MTSEDMKYSLQTIVIKHLCCFLLSFCCLEAHISIRFQFENNQVMNQKKYCLIKSYKILLKFSPINVDGMYTVGQKSI